MINMLGFHKALNDLMVLSIIFVDNFAWDTCRDGMYSNT
jgi:hypothetical protein